MEQDQDLRSIIASHESELTDMERDIAQYFIVRSDSIPLSLLVSLNYVSKAVLTRFSQNVVLLAIGSLFTILMKKLRIKSKITMVNLLQCFATLPPYQ